MQVRDKGLKNAFQPIQNRLAGGGTITQSDVQKLVDAARDGKKITATEQADLGRILSTYGDRFEPAARADLVAFVNNPTVSGGTPSGGGSSPLAVRIQNATMRKELAGTDGLPGALTDGNLSRTEANRLMEIVNRDGRVSGREQRDLRTLLRSNIITMEPAARERLENAAGMLVEPRTSDRVPGSQLQSAHVRADAFYRSEGLPIATLEKAGVDPAVLDVLRRADELGGNSPNGTPSAAELVKLEQQGALLPAEVAALSKAWILMEVQALELPSTPELPELKVRDLSVRPQALDLANVPVDVSSLPESLRAAAQRAILVNRGGADLSRVTLGDIQTALKPENSGRITPSDAELLRGAVDAAVRTQALQATAPQYQARVELPAPGKTSTELLRSNHVNITMESTTAITGGVSDRGFWTNTRFWARSYPHNPVGMTPTTFPEQRSVKMELSRTHDLRVDLPPDARMMLVGTSGNTHVVTGDGRLPDALSGDFRALVVKDGQLLEQFALRIPTRESKDLSAYYGFEAVTPEGGSLKPASTGTSGFSSSVYTGAFRLEVGTPDAANTSITLQPGRYQGTFSARQPHQAFTLDVLPGGNLEVDVDGKKARLVQPRHDTSTRDFRGTLEVAPGKHVDVSFDAESSRLRLIEETVRESHGTDGMIAEVRARELNAAVVSVSNRVG